MTADLIDLDKFRADKEAEERLGKMLRESLAPCRLCGDSMGSHTQQEREVCGAILNTMQPKEPA